MYENEAISNEAMIGIKRNNEVLAKGINRMDDISKNDIKKTTN
jgi:hypothetical protein